MGDFRFKNYRTTQPFPKFEPNEDYDPKLQPISAEPDFQVIARNPAEVRAAHEQTLQQLWHTYWFGSQDEFLFLACDGIWDVMSTQIAGKFVRKVFALQSCVFSYMLVAGDQGQDSDCRLPQGERGVSLVEQLGQHDFYDRAVW